MPLVESLEYEVCRTPVKMAVVAALGAVLALTARTAIVDAATDARPIVEEDPETGPLEVGALRGSPARHSTRTGKTSEKRWTYERLGAHGQSKSVLRFTAPAEVGRSAARGEPPGSRSDQWMWTPAIERDRRIAMQDRSTRFFGTDFSFEDLEERDVDQYDYAVVGEEVDRRCWLLGDSGPCPTNSKSSQYSKSIIWIRKDNYALARIDLYVKSRWSGG